MARLKTLIRNIRSEFDAIMKVVIGEINPPAVDYPYTYMVIGYEMQTTYDYQATQMISTYQLQKQADEIHYNTAGQLELGKRFAAPF